jgi:CRP/FNR family transcriptional regulator
MTLINILKRSSIFKTLSPEALQKLEAGLKTRTIPAGEVLFNLGDPGTEMIIVRRGKIAIYMPVADRPREGQALRIFRSGETLGEMALIDRLPRSASARAETRAVIASLDGDTFKHLLEDYPDLAMDVMSGLSGRIRYTTDFIGEIRQWVQQLAEGNYQSIQEPGKLQDSSLSALAADFVRMAAQVREREEKLQQEVVQLRIQIDENKRQQEVSQITESDYYISLKEKLKALREQEDDVVYPTGSTMNLIYEQIEAPGEPKEPVHAPAAAIRSIYDKIEETDHSKKGE